LFLERVAHSRAVNVKDGRDELHRQPAGAVFERDLGPQTPRAASGNKAYNPVDAWKCIQA
jgi:hypothetical protein